MDICIKSGCINKLDARLFAARKDNNKMKIIKYIIVFLLLTTGFNYVSAQTVKKYLKTEIDSILKIKVQRQNKIDTLFSVDGGETKFYKRIGFIKIRTGKGISNPMKILVDGKLYLAIETHSKIKKKRITNYTDKYYFIDNRLVKFETSEYWRNKIENSWTTKHKVILYFYENEVIDRTSEINDNYKFSKKDNEWIFRQALKILEETR